MNVISKPVATRRAHLVWQRPLELANDGSSRDRHAVAELRQLPDGDKVSFRYLDEDSLKTPRNLGFNGYPGLPFDAEKVDNDRNAIALLRLRLPPSDRTDFGDMLVRFGLPSDWDHTDLSLLAYTGARQVHDSFSVCETFDGFDDPFSYVFDLAGVRHYRQACESLSAGDALEFVRDRENPYDSDAVKIVRPGVSEDEATVGYVNRIQAKTVGQWLDNGTIRSEVLRFNGRPDYPRLFVHAEVFPTSVFC